MAPTPNRPFFANFFQAFKAPSSYQKVAPAITSSTSASQQSASKHTQTSQSRSRSTSPAPSPSQAQPITSKPPQTTSSTAAAVAAQAFQAARSPPAPYRPPSTSPPPRSPAPAYTPPRSPPPRQSRTIQRSRTPSQTRCVGRRSSTDSDGSSKGTWREAFAGGSGGQNWYIGGVTATGEERFYKLGMCRRYGSHDRLSLDRLSL